MVGCLAEYPFPADHFKINNKNNNPKMFILFSGKQARQSASFKISEFITNSSSARMMKP